jgi:hypothetical protein
LNQWKDDIAELKRRRQQVDVEIKGVASQIAEVQSSIKDVVGRIDKSVVGSQEWTYLVDKEKDLRDQEKDLRDKEKRLDDKEKDLREEKKRLDEEQKRLDEKTQKLDFNVRYSFYFQCSCTVYAVCVCSLILYFVQTFSEFIAGQLSTLSQANGIGKRYCLTKRQDHKKQMAQVALDREPQIRQFLEHAWDRFQRPVKVCGSCLIFGFRLCDDVFFFFLHPYLSGY